MVESETSRSDALQEGTMFRRGDELFEMVDDEHLGMVAVEIGDRTLTDDRVPEIGDDCIVPGCDGHVKDVNGERWCSEGCLQWMRTTAQDGDECDSYGDRCDGRLEVTVRDDGSVEHECDTCSRRGVSFGIQWREAWLPGSEPAILNGGASL